ncbi:hypothetical protein E2C01_002562 [Portunus trituberculatus]|uniref:Uncharacterized protein n=1 Tax=Portunus trituberculatus TaxID=210409 RepID=A0A5B7CJP0_PORTR|nr:hypothetical protein [Portunus trituberculatus]
MHGSHYPFSTGGELQPSPNPNGSFVRLCLDVYWLRNQVACVISTHVLAREAQAAIGYRRPLDVTRTPEISGEQLECGKLDPNAF